LRINTTTDKPDRKGEDSLYFMICTNLPPGPAQEIFTAEKPPKEELAISHSYKMLALGTALGKEGMLIKKESCRG